MLGTLKDRNTRPGITKIQQQAQRFRYSPSVNLNLGLSRSGNGCLALWHAYPRALDHPTHRRHAHAADAATVWAVNAIVGRLVHDLVPSITLNLLRWVLAFFILQPIAWPIFRRGSALFSHWKRFAVLGQLGIGMYNALQNLALQNFGLINVTRVAASMST